MDRLTKLYLNYINGDKSAFECLLNESKNGLIFYINRYVHDLHTAEDLSEDVFVSLLMHPRRFNGTASVKTYLYTIGRNKAIDYLRRHRRVIVTEENIESDSVLLVEAESEIKERNAVLHRCISQLNDNYAEVLHLIYFADMSYEQAAKVMKKNPKQIENLAYRARKSLKILLEKEGIELEK